MNLSKEFKSLKEVDENLFDEIQSSCSCELSSIDCNRSCESNEKFGRLVLCGTFKDDGSKKVLFIGLAPSYRRFDSKLRAFFPADLKERSSGAFFFNSMIRTKLVNDYDVYVTNLMKCSTAENQVPTKSQIERDLIYLKKEISLVDPDFLVCMGNAVSEYFEWFFGKKENVFKIAHPSFYFRMNDLDRMDLEFNRLKRWFSSNESLNFGKTRRITEWLK